MFVNDTASVFVYDEFVGNGADAVSESEMADDKAGAEKLEALKARASYGVGADHGMLRRMGRRCSVTADEIMGWFPEDLQAYQLAFRKENR